MTLCWFMQEFCLHALVASRHDRGLLFEALYGLSSGHAAALLHYLHTWLRHHRQLAAGPTGLAGAPWDACPSYAGPLSSCLHHSICFVTESVSSSAAYLYGVMPGTEHIGWSRWEAPALSWAQASQRRRLKVAWPCAPRV